MLCECRYGIGKLCWFCMNYVGQAEQHGHRMPKREEIPGASCTTHALSRTASGAKRRSLYGPPEPPGNARDAETHMSPQLATPRTTAASVVYQPQLSQLLLRLSQLLLLLSLLLPQLSLRLLILLPALKFLMEGALYAEKVYVSRTLTQFSCSLVSLACLVEF